MASPTQSPLQEKLKARMAELEAAAAAPPEPESGGLFGRGGTLGLGLGADPWQTTMARTVNPFIKRLGGETTESVSKYVLPQNAVELALAAVMPGGGLTGGLAAKTGLAGAKAVKGVVGRAALKALEGAGVGGAVGAATGHDWPTSGVTGAIGGAAGSLVGEGGKAVLSQIPTVRGIVGEATEKLQGAFRSLLGDVRVPAGESAAATVKRVALGDVVKAVEKDVAATLGNRYNVNPKGFETDPAMIRMGQDAIKAGVSDIYDKTGKTLSLKKMWENLPAARGELATRWFSPAAQKQFAEESQRLTGAQLVQDLVTEAQGKVKQFYDDAGNLTTEGLAALQEGFHGKLADLGNYFKPAQLKELATALGQDIAGGVQKGVAGVMPDVSMNVKHLMLPTVTGGRLPVQPGWEAARSSAAKLGEAGTEAAAAAAAQAPVKIGGDTRPAPLGPPRPEPPWAKDLQPALPPTSTPISAPMMPVSPERSAPEASAPPPLAPTEDATSRWFVPPPPERPQPPAP